MTFLENLKAMLAAIGSWGQRYVGGVFMENKDGKMVVSIGRISFLSVLVLMLWVWYRGVVYEEPVAMPAHVMEVFYVLAGYVFGSKVVGLFKEKWANGKPK